MTFRQYALFLHSRLEAVLGTAGATAWVLTPKNARRVAGSFGALRCSAGSFADVLCADALKEAQGVPAPAPHAVGKV
jgi:hypothetical protein